MFVVTSIARQVEGVDFIEGHSQNTGFCDKAVATALILVLFESSPRATL